MSPGQMGGHNRGGHKIILPASRISGVHREVLKARGARGGGDGERGAGGEALRGGEGGGGHTLGGGGGHKGGGYALYGKL